jgi:cytochrome c-type biogenesis protein CcmH
MARARAHRDILIAPLALLMLMIAAAHAAPLADARVRELTEGFRCVVCQNQTLADSSAPLAADLRARIREQVMLGASDEQIRAFMVKRYGDFVLYRPPLKPATWALWFGPLAAFALGVAALGRALRRARRGKAQT